VYKTFSIFGSEDKYRLNVAQYNGTTGNSLFGLPNRYHDDQNMKFSTPDQDSDNYAGGKCSTVSGPGKLFYDGKVYLKDSKFCRFLKLSTKNYLDETSQAGLRVKS